MNTLERLTTACLLTLVAVVPAGAQMTDGFELHTDNVVEPITLAQLELSNGNEVHFYGVPESGEILVGEISDVGYEQFVIEPGTAPAEVFFKIAPAHTPVPRMIADSDPDLFRWYEKVDLLEDKVRAVGVEVPVRSLAKAGGGSCQTGSAGATYFRQNHCYTGGGPGYGKSEKYCYDGSYNTLQKTSASSMRATYSRMASCGGATNRLRHSRNTASGFQTHLDIYVAPQKVVTYWSSKPGIKWKRRVRMEEVGSAGWVRGWIAYHEQAAY